MIDKEGLNYIDLEQLKSFLDDSQVFLSQEEIEELFEKLDKQKKGKISIKEFKKNFIAELKTFSTSNVDMIHEDDEFHSVNNINDIDIDISPNKVSKGEDE